MSLLCCPVCGGALEQGEKTYRCGRGHSFDRASSGYVNLLPPRAKPPGDNAQMVAARAQFLAEGYYDPLREALGETVCRLLGGRESPALLDAGCGEGYYTDGMVRALERAGCHPRAVGLDLSKYALRRAAKRTPQGEFVLGSLFHLPVADRSLDLVADVFAPVCPGEFSRVLRDDGVLLLAVPGSRHLWGLKKLLYDKPYTNDEEPPDHRGFAVREKLSLSRQVVIRGQAAIEALFQMTPYFWKTSPQAAARLEGLDRLETEIAFDLYLLDKEKPGQAGSAHTHNGQPNGKIGKR